MIVWLPWYNRVVTGICVFIAAADVPRPVGLAVPDGAFFPLSWQIISGFETSISLRNYIFNYKSIKYHYVI